MELFLTIIIIFIVVGWIFGKLFPRLLLWYIAKKAKNFNGGNGANFGGFNGFAGFNGFNGYANANGVNTEDQVKESKKQEGRVSVSRIVRQEKVIDSTMGEYVEYESVEVIEEDKKELN